MRFTIEEHAQHDRELQVLGWLAFPLTSEGWDDYLAWMQEIEVDYEQQAAAALKENREELLHVLPSELHPYVLDGTLNRPYPPPEMTQLIQSWMDAAIERSQERSRLAQAAYKSIQDRLPRAAVELHEYSLHDAQLLSCEWLSEERLALLLDESSRGQSPSGQLSLIFQGVHKAQLPEDLTGAYWYAEEYKLAESGFMISILLQHAQGGRFSEFWIEARDLQIEHVETGSE